MLEDHKTKLEDLTDKLIDVVIEESNPFNWSGGTKKMSAMSAKERGDRHWDKKNAVATLTIVTKVQTLLGMIERKVAPTDQETFDLGKQVAEAEKEANKILEKIMAKK